MTITPSPLQGPPPSEVPLPNAPLVRVMAQVRFPVVASVVKSDFIAPFQEALRSEYPVLRPEALQTFLIASDGTPQVRHVVIWRFQAADGAWVASLAPDFVALETTRYASRDDFLARLARVLEAVSVHVKPGLVDRIGLRYVDRIHGTGLDDLADLLRPEVAGIAGTSFASAVEQSITETVFVLPDGRGKLMTRWGRIPANATTDQAVLPALDEESWILDIDAFDHETRAFDVHELIDQSRGFAERIYSFFRWAVTREFLIRYGGQP